MPVEVSMKDFPEVLDLGGSDLTPWYGQNAVTLWKSAEQEGGQVEEAGPCGC